MLFFYLFGLLYLQSEEQEKLEVHSGSLYLRAQFSFIFGLKLFGDFGIFLRLNEKK